MSGVGICYWVLWDSTSLRARSWSGHETQLVDRFPLSADRIWSQWGSVDSCQPSPCCHCERSNTTISLQQLANSNLTNCSFINWCIDKQDFNLSEMIGNGKIITVFCVQLFHNVGYASPITIIKINEGNNWNRVQLSILWVSYATSSVGLPSPLSLKDGLSGVMPVVHSHMHKFQGRQLLVWYFAVVTSGCRHKLQL